MTRTQQLPTRFGNFLNFALPILKGALQGMPSDTGLSGGFAPASDPFGQTIFAEPQPARQQLFPTPQMAEEVHSALPPLLARLRGEPERRAGSLRPPVGPRLQRTAKRLVPTEQRDSAIEPDADSLPVADLAPFLEPEGATVPFRLPVAGAVADGRFQLQAEPGKTPRPIQRQPAAPAGPQPGPQQQPGKARTQPANQEKKPPSQVINDVRQSAAYQKADGNTRVQMLFDAVPQQHGQIAAVDALDEFAASKNSRQDLETFRVGNDTDGYNVGRSAARHFFKSARINVRFGPVVAKAAGELKEVYDLIPLIPGVYDVKDRRTNDAGNRLGQHISITQRHPGAIHLRQFTQTPVKSKK